MKRNFVLLLVSLIFLTGCTIEQQNIKDIDKMVATILGKKLNLYNQISNGYKYYLPRGLRVIDNTSYNEKIYSKGNTYYLYVDVVSYQFKRDLTYDENDKAYLSKKLNYNKNKGYLEITKTNNNLYFVEMMYNYGKIEALVPKNDIPETVINASYILGSLTFNDRVIKILFEEGTNEFVEKPFELFKPKRKEGNFLDYDKEFGQYEEIIDEDKIIPSEDKENQGTINNLLE
ncbi:MAG TPA: hypothetical protein GXZ95_04195 [Mollicutes bacterium]|nr:hypothetical protein [Mollicutes bacterium]